MSTYYVDGSVGNNSWDGTVAVFTSGTTGPKLSLNGGEDKPVAAGDTVNVRTVDAAGVPIVYRELLTIDVSGTAGNPISYIADVSGVIWGVPGYMARITGSDNDTTATRASCITATSRNYRTFRGFIFDTTTAITVTLLTACGNWIIEDCYFPGLGANSVAISFAGTGTNSIVRRCSFMGARGICIDFTHTSVVDNSGHVVENCLFLGAGNRHFSISRIGGITIRHCTMLFVVSVSIRVLVALTTGQTTTVNNCIFGWNAVACQAQTAPGTNEEITENYNTFYGNSTDRTNVSTGANSNTFPPLFAPPVMLAGYMFPWSPFALSPWSPIKRLAGTGMSSDGFYGIPRPTTDSKKSWGAIQYNGAQREVTTKRTGAAALKLDDAGVRHIKKLVTAVSTTVSVYVQWEADYAGTKPQMVIRQAGQSDITVTATGSSGSWELLTNTWTPAAGFVEIELRSNNTATSTNYKVFWDDLV